MNALRRLLNENLYGVMSEGVGGGISTMDGELGGEFSTMGCE